jgi:hypothetical protein
MRVSLQDNATVVSSKMDALAGDNKELYTILADEMEEWGMPSELCA